MGSVERYGAQDDDKVYYGDKALSCLEAPGLGDTRLTGFCGVRRFLLQVGWDGRQYDASFRT